MEPLNSLNLDQGFKRYFEVVPAVSQSLREAVFRVRHQVYCEDLGFEAVRADGMETDEYDGHSLHCLLRAVANGEFIGCVRVVLARRDDPEYPLPFEKTCAAGLDRSIIDPFRLPRDKIGEVTRLAVIKRYRRRKGEEQVPIAIDEQDFGTPEQPRFPYIPLALYFSSAALAAHHGIDTLFILTEPRLAKHVTKLGFKLTQIGEPVEHRGVRVPSVVNVRDVPADLRRAVKPLYDLVVEEVANGL